MDKIKGLVSALFTPLKEDGSINFDVLPQMIDDAIAADITGFYVLGSTGEGISLSTDERKALAESAVNLVEGRVPVMIQVGHNSLAESKRLARHAQEIGATAISANAPSYFKVSNVDVLVDCMAEISRDTQLPFYYYHIPPLTGAYINMVEFLQKAPSKIPSLAGIKFSEMDPGKFLQCKNFAGGKYDVLWGCDEQLISALAVGAEGAVGSTYGFMPKLYQEVMKNFNSGKMEEARSLMQLAYEVVEALNRHAPIHPCMKAVMRMLGYEVGNHRLPQPALSSAQEELLKADLERLGFFEWSIRPLVRF